MVLTLGMPEMLNVAFETEAISSLPRPARISSCVDPAYWAGDRRFDFNVWAAAAREIGIERLYVSDQEFYRSQWRDQLHDGFAMHAHDWPHRYIPGPGSAKRANHTTYSTYFTESTAYFVLCLHEHWYDEWIFTSHSTDEYFTYEPRAAHAETMGVGEEPTAREGQLYQSIQRLIGHQNDSTPCTALLCVNRPFYGPSPRESTEEPAAWTHPNTPAARLKFSAHGGQLSIERFTRRYNRLPPRGSVRKCFVHPDWRLGTQFKAHGFTMKSCAPRLATQECVRGRSNASRDICLQLCGFWRATNESCPRCNAHPAQCDRLSGAVLRDVELAHFRLPPPENARSGYRNTSWLTRDFAARVRERVGRFANDSRSGILARWAHHSVTRPRSHNVTRPRSYSTHDPLSNRMRDRGAGVV
eukprot:2615847-Prymnesium_polylepis.1